jgi:hypothetical protein
MDDDDKRSLDEKIFTEAELAALKEVGGCVRLAATRDGRNAFRTQRAHLQSIRVSAGGLLHSFTICC